MKGIPKGNYPMFTCIMAAFIEEGFRVVRGPDWCWGEQDGGEGNVGTVVEVKEENLERDGTVYGGTAVGVYWDNGTLSNYRCGFDGKYDVVVLDTAPAGSCHTSVFCRECHVTPVCGLRWKCSTCYDFDLCSQCYSDNKHSLEHRFHRYDTRHCESTSVSPRSGSRRVQAKGFFKGAVVSRGKDWCWGDQDGREDKTGVVQSLRDSEKESFRSVAEVQWRGSEAASSTNIYRVGHKGKVDLKCVTAGEGGHYYPQHLPMAGAPSYAAPGTDSALTIGSGDRVKVELDPEIFELMQNGHGGWNVKMAECLDQVGVVHSVLENGDVRVIYGQAAWTLNPNSIALVKDGHSSPGGHAPKESPLSDNSSSQSQQTAPSSLATTTTNTTTGSVVGTTTTSSPSATTTETTTITTTTTTIMESKASTSLDLGFHLFREGDVVRVEEDMVHVHDLQEDHGGWNDDMALSLGQLGRVLTVFSSGDCRVKVNGYSWTFNPNALTPAPGETPPDVPDQALGSSSMDLQMRLLQMLGGSRMIIHAVATENANAVRECIAKDPDSVNEVVGDYTPLQVAVDKGNIEIVNILLKHSANVNMQDTDGDRPLHLCAFKSQAEIGELLLGNGAHPNLKNHRGQTPLHIAAAKGNIRLVKAILSAPDVEASLQTADGDTALHLTLSVSPPSEGIALLLLESGADPALTSEDSSTCLHAAAQAGRARVCEAILKQSPHLVNVKKKDGMSPLHLASLNGCCEVAKVLVEFEKCDIDAVSSLGQTALHLAIHPQPSAAILELLIGHGIDLNVANEKGWTALHFTFQKDSIFGITDDCPQLAEICSTLDDLPGHTMGSAAVGCLLAREGADVHYRGVLDLSPLMTCDPEVAAHVTKFTQERSVFHGSLRKHPKPSPAELAAFEQELKQGREGKLPTPAKGQPKSTSSPRTGVTAKPDSSTEKVASERVALPVPSVPVSVGSNKPTPTPTATPSPRQPVATKQPPAAVNLGNHGKDVNDDDDDDDNVCILCDSAVDVRIVPCGHAVLCRSHASSAKRCPQCRGPIQSIAELDPLCAMCQERPCTVSLRPCEHAMCAVCAQPMKRCFECKAKITSKVSLDQVEGSVESSPEPNGTHRDNLPADEDETLCTLCCDNKKNTAFTCGHQLCYDCSLKVDLCPICREQIKFRIKLH